MTALTPQLSVLVARRFALLGDPTRLRLLNAMNERSEASVGQLAEAVDGSQANVSKHLNLLLAERMVARRREGNRVIYRIADPTLIQICDQVCDGLAGQVEELNVALSARTPEGSAP